MISLKDNTGSALDGSRAYRLHVPANVPAEQHWSVTAHDRQTHALIRNMPRASRASNIADLAKNPDGYLDLYFGPAAPKGKEANWIPTDPKRGFEVMFRAYGPTKQFMDKAWKLPDLVAVQGPARGMLQSDIALRSIATTIEREARLRSSDRCLMAKSVIGH